MKALLCLVAACATDKGFGTDAERNHEQNCAAAFAAGDFATSERQCLLCLEFDDHNAQCLNGLGLVWYARSNDDKAREYFIRAVRENNDFAQARNNLGVLEFDNEDYDAAIPYFASAFEIDPHFLPARYNLALCHFRLAHRAIARGADPTKFLDEAELQYRLLLEIAPAHAEAQRDLAALMALKQQ